MNTTNNDQTIELLINQHHIEEIRLLNQNTPNTLSEGQVLMKVDRFAFTANNITYAALGKALNYWNFFPTEEGWGKLPTWGFAAVIASHHPEIEVGERIYGYFPMASHLLVEAGKVNPFSFVDQVTHRQALAPVYNQYIRTQNDPSYHADYEALQMLFRPLFITAFLLDDFLNEQSFFNGKQLIFTSASSKTALALAFILQQNRAERQDQIELIGLTSKSNVAFVEGLNFYHQVKAYEEVDQLAQEESVVVDFAGNIALLEKLDAYLQTNLKYISLIGASHWDQRVKGSNDLGEKAKFFFAPTQANKRTKEWGAMGFQERVAKVWLPFLTSAQQWLQIKEHTGAAALTSLYQAMVQGNINPKEGNIVII